MNTQGGAARLELRDAPMPEPGPTQLLVRVRAAGLNRGEFIVGHGLTPLGTAKPLGLEGAGEVVRVGAQVQGFAPGDRVMGRFGAAFSEHALVPAAEALPVPSHLSWEEAGALPLTWILAHDMLVTHGGLRAGGWLLVTGVSSGVGVGALQLAKLLGAKVIGTSGSREKLDQLRKLGLDVALCTRQPDFFSAVQDATGGAGVQLVVNTVGGSVFAECVRCMAFEGRLATVGYVDGVLNADMDLQALHMKRLVLFGVSNKMLDAEQKAQAAAAFAHDVLPRVREQQLRPLVDRAYAFDALPAARERMEANAHAGKIVLTG
jgi:NADPH:quinone reductase-like Zn-dependent oxidoreductase